MTLDDHPDEVIGPSNLSRNLHFPAEIYAESVPARPESSRSRTTPPTPRGSDSISQTRM
jgi:hypothetical protein